MTLVYPFDEVSCINLQRRADRWEQFLKRLPVDWPFKPVTRFAGIDGNLCPPPPWWTRGPGAWGCHRSHARVFEDCLQRGAESILIFEDDAIFAENFTNDAQQFFAKLPDDWQMVYLGGQCLKVHFHPPTNVNDWVYQPLNVNRTHAYAVRGEAIRTVYRHLHRRDWYPSP